MLEHRLFVVGQRDFEHALDSAAAQDDGDADEQPVDSVLAFEQCGAGQDAALVQRDAVDHLRDGRGGRVKGAAGLEQVDDFRAAVAGALDDRIDLILRQQFADRDARGGGVGGERHHRVAVAAQHVGLHIFDADG